MGKFNTYRYLVLEDAEDLKRNGRRRNRAAGKNQRLFLICLFFGVLLFIGFYSTILHTLIDSLASRLGFTDVMYSVVVDTNDVQTQLYVYRFHKYLFGNKLCLEQETLLKSKPGLSLDVYQQNKGEQLYSLLKQACGSVALDKSVVTPLLLRVTENPSSLLLERIYQLNQVIKEYFDYVSSIKSPFFMKQKYFSILKRPEEALDVWIGVNYLLDDKKKLSVLDMDDDSLHMVVQLEGKDVHNHTTIQPGPRGRVPLFIKSYPNLGLLAARLGILKLENPTESQDFHSTCINPIIKNLSWTYRGNEYLISGPDNPSYLNHKETWITVSSRIPIVNTTTCVQLVKRYVQDRLEEQQLPHMDREQSLFFFGHFFQQASDIGLIDAMEGGELSLRSLEEVQSVECSTPNIDQPWVCLDLLYMRVLLGRLLDPQAHYQLLTKLNNHKLSWTLGAAYKTLHNLMESGL